MTRLHYRGGTSDKIYELSIVRAGVSNYDVHFAYGRRGSTLKQGVKNSYPLSEAEAQRVHDRLLQEKLGKGYRIMSSDGAVYTESYIIENEPVSHPPKQAAFKPKTRSGKNVLIMDERSLEL